MKPGYKQTEVGVIPFEWEVKCIDECVRSDAPICYGILMPGPHCDDGVPVVKVRDIGDRGIDESFLLLTSPVIDEAYKRSRLLPGDMLVTIRGTTGRVAIASAALKGANITQDTARLRLKSIVSTEFIYYELQSESAQKYVRLHTIGQAVKGINIRDVRRITVTLPPIPEQRAIAATLGDANGLIESLERLIAKKRAIKQGAMQELLTGRRRLPGFKGEWKAKTLGELFNFSGGYSASRDQLSATGHCYLHYGDIHTSSKTYIDVQAESRNIPRLNIPLTKVSSGSLLDDGDVVFVDASEDDEGTSKHVVVINQAHVPYISGLHTIVAKAKTDELVHEYRRYCFQTAAIRQQFLFYAVGTKVTGISKKNIVKLTMPVPSKSEQTAIAVVLSDMDAEIAALEGKLGKARAIKQGMMQELLTGRIRLV